MCSYCGCEGITLIGRFVAEVVCHVDEIGLLRRNALGNVDGLVEREVGGVVTLAEGVEDQGFDAAEEPPGFGRDGGDIGAIGQRKGS